MQVTAAINAPFTWAPVTALIGAALANPFPYGRKKNPAEVAIRKLCTTFNKEQDNVRGGTADVKAKGRVLCQLPAVLVHFPVASQ